MLLEQLHVWVISALFVPPFLDCHWSKMKKGRIISQKGSEVVCVFKEIVFTWVSGNRIFLPLHVVLFNIGETMEWEWQELLCSMVQIRGQEHEVGISCPSYRKPGAAFRSRNFHQEDALTFQLLSNYALLMHQTTDIIYKPLNGNNWSHFIISMSS